MVLKCANPKDKDKGGGGSPSDTAGGFLLKVFSSQSLWQTGIEQQGWEAARWLEKEIKWFVEVYDVYEALVG